MIFRQMFEPDTSTYTYLIACESTRQAALIDPVKGDIEKYLQLLRELDLKLAYALDTHVHADHITALGDLRAATGCTTVMGAESKAACVSKKVDDGDVMEVGKLKLIAMSTPGHTDDSYCYRMTDRVFTGDTLLIRGTGRTDFQSGDSRAQYKSLFEKILVLPAETWVYPGHDYKGWTVSTIGEELAHNPRLQVSDESAYVALMASLKLPSPKYMDIAVPANLACGVADGS